MHLEKNQLTQIEELGKSIGKLTSVTSFSLDLRSNQLTQIEELGKSIGKLTSVTSFTLYLHYNKLTQIEELGKSIGKLTSVTSFTLYLYNNQLTQIEALINVIANNNFTSKFYLDISNNNLGKDQILLLAASIKKSPTKITLDYDGNPIGEEGKKALQEALELNSNSEHRQAQKEARKLEQAKQSPKDQILELIEWFFSQKAPINVLLSKFNQNNLKYCDEKLKFCTIKDKSYTKEIVKKALEYIQQNLKTYRLEHAVKWLKGISKKEHKTLVEVINLVREIYKNYADADAKYKFPQDDGNIMVIEDAIAIINTEQNVKYLILAYVKANDTLKNKSNIEEEMVISWVENSQDATKEIWSKIDEKIFTNLFKKCLDEITEDELFSQESETDKEFVKLNTNANFEIIFNSDECFNIFAAQDISMCLKGTKVQVISNERRADQCNNLDGCMHRASWSIKTNRCLLSFKDYLDICTIEFEKKSSIPCDDFNVLQELDFDIESLITSQVTAKFSSDYCFDVFQIKNLKICSSSTKAQILPKEKIKECDNTNGCIYYPTWEIAINYCPSSFDDYLNICTTEFKDKNFIPCGEYGWNWSYIAKFGFTIFTVAAVCTSYYWYPVLFTALQSFFNDNQINQEEIQQIANTGEEGRPQIQSQQIMGLIDKQLNDNADTAQF